MDDQDDFFDLQKIMSRAWGSLITRDRFGLSAIVLLIGYIDAEQSGNKEAMSHLVNLLRSSVEKMSEAYPPKINRDLACSFCGRGSIPLVAGHGGFICSECATIALEELNRE